MSLKSKIFTIKSFITNPFQTGKIAYVVESKDWAIQQVGKQIANHCNIPTFITATPWGIKNKIIHFGSLHTIRHKQNLRKFHPSNKTVVSIFHLVPEKKGNTEIKDITKNIHYIHTASSITKQQLIQLGIPKEKIIIIPLGVDLGVFTSASTKEKQNIKSSLNIPKERFVIGSFQKDGEGWNKGETPKKEKGPDILVETLKKVAKHNPIHVLLVGPARGYVTKKLKNARIPFTNIGYLKDTKDVAKYYKALDAYLISARIEGGPLALLEAWASAVPVISTNVGMIPDITTHEKNILISKKINSDNLATQLQKIITNKQRRKALSIAGNKESKKYSWENVSKRYEKLLYKPLR